MLVGGIGFPHAMKAVKANWTFPGEFYGKEAIESVLVRRICRV